MYKTFKEFAKLLDPRKDIFIDIGDCMCQLLDPKALTANISQVLDFFNSLGIDYTISFDCTDYKYYLFILSENASNLTQLCKPGTNFCCWFSRIRDGILDDRPITNEELTYLEDGTYADML